MVTTMQFLRGCSLLCLLLLMYINPCFSQSDICITVPQETVLCEQTVGVYKSDPTAARVYCLQKLFWGYPVSDNLTKAEIEYFEKKSQQFIEDPRPPSGYKTRKEYRTLTDQERERVHAAFQALYKDGTIEKYAKLNSNAAITGHGGPAFLGFHRVLAAFFEEEMRRVEPTVSLPYWDYTLDAEMDNPVNSMLWSSKYFGNANGEVVTGPFQKWFTPKGPLQRYYGQSSFGKLTTKDEFMAIFRKCRLEEVSFPSSPERTKRRTLSIRTMASETGLEGPSQTRLCPLMTLCITCSWLSMITNGSVSGETRECDVMSKMTKIILMVVHSPDKGHLNEWLALVN